jgi:hypothetical protein
MGWITTEPLFAAVMAAPAISSDGTQSTAQLRLEKFHRKCKECLADKGITAEAPDTEFSAIVAAGFVAQILKTDVLRLLQTDLGTDFYRCVTLSICAQ